MVNIIGYYGTETRPRFIASGSSVEVALPNPNFEIKLKDGTYDNPSWNICVTVHDKHTGTNRYWCEKADITPEGNVLLYGMPQPERDDY